MIERFGNDIELICDECPTIFPGVFDRRDRDVMMADAKAAGWRSFKRDGKWRNACPTCVRHFARLHQSGRLV